MNLPPVIAALRKHKTGAIMIALQIAVTLAIVCNALFIIGQRINRVERPTGLDEKDLFVVSQQWVEAPNAATPEGLKSLDVMLREDVSTLQGLPDISSVSSVNSLPLLGKHFRLGGLGLGPDQKQSTADTVYYFGGEAMLSTLGLRLMEGRAFNSGEINYQGAHDPIVAPVVIVTDALARKLFPQGSPIGKVIYLDGGSAPSTIVGVVDRMQSPAVENWASSFTWNSTLIPNRAPANYSSYVIRAKPGRLDAAMQEIQPALYRLNPSRVLDSDSVKSFSEVRAEAYRTDIGMAILMSIISLILLSVTAAGIIGVSGFWVRQRHKQIGVRRALGARKVDILIYFQVENIVIAIAGAIVGSLLSLGLNSVLMSHYEMDRLPFIYILSGFLIVLILGQLASYVPARRAAKVPPAVATRV
jgi:putative ABC transport system permease protein